MNYHIILSFLTSLALLWLNADYIVSNRRSKKLNKLLHYFIYVIGLLNVILPLVYILINKGL